MLETIYTIPINEAFDEASADHSIGCPFCRLKQKLEENELDLILGASMMEPDIRIKTNEAGFCRQHFEKMLTMKNRLGLALMLESHLNELREDITPKALTDAFGKKGSHTVSRLKKLDDSCYVCSRLEHSMSRMLENAALLWETDPDFQKKLEKQPWFCMNHFRMFIEAGQANINKKRYPDFYKALCNVQFAYFDTLREDISWFCKKFDYRYDKEPWGNAKDAPERTLTFLCGK